MPLDKSGSKASVGNNIRTELHAHPEMKQKQAVAIALSVARRAKRGTGGALSDADWLERTNAHLLTNRSNTPKIPQIKPPTPLAIKGNPISVTPVGQAMAGMPKAGGMPKPQFPKLPGAPQGIKLPKVAMKSGGEVLSQGALLGSTPGRADKINAKVEDGAYVLPADCVSACGENSSLAGHAAIERMISKLPQVKSTKRKDYGSKPVPVALSDGEHLISRESVERIGGGDYEKGRRILDHFVLHIRRRHIHELSKLPPPAEGDE